MTRVVLDLPDELARDAKAAGLLAPRALEALIQREVEIRKGSSFWDAIDRLRGLQDEYPMTEEQVRLYVNEAVTEVRAEDRA